MGRFKTQCKKWLRQIWFLIIPLLAVLGVVACKGIYYLWTQVFIPIYGEIDYQRSTLWPMFVSLAITMLGSLITTYIFLKDALDQALSEKPYYRTVVDKYRQETMKSLWRYSILTLIFIAFTLALYFVLYFFNKRSHYLIRIALFVCYCVGMIISFCILHKCIHIEGGLYNVADKLLKETLEYSRGYPRNVWAVRTILRLNKKI